MEAEESGSIVPSARDLRKRILRMPVFHVANSLASESIHPPEGTRRLRDITTSALLYPGGNAVAPEPRAVRQFGWADIYLLRFSRRTLQPPAQPHQTRASLSRQLHLIIYITSFAFMINMMCRPPRASTGCGEIRSRIRNVRASLGRKSW